MNTNYTKTMIKCINYLSQSANLSSIIVLLLFCFSEKLLKHIKYKLDEHIFHVTTFGLTISL